MEIIDSITAKFRIPLLMRLPLIRQKERFDCGIACLNMIASFYGQSGNLPTGNNFDTDENGISVREMISYAESLNLVGNVQKITPDQLLTTQLPAILHWNGNHFVTLKRLIPSGAVLHDPAVGKTVATWQDINEKFTGIVIQLRPMLKKQPTRFAKRMLYREKFSTLAK